MIKRIKQFALVAVMLGVTLGIFSAPAMAEQCSTDGKICLVTDTSQPLLPGSMLQFKVPSEATRAGIGVPAGLEGGLVEQGPPGGMSLWQATLNAGAVANREDGPLNLEVFAAIPYPECDPMTGNGCGSEEYKTTFAALYVNPMINPSVQIRRTKSKVTAIYWFEARIAMEAEIRIMLNSFKGENPVLKYVTRTWSVGPGAHELKLNLPRNIINRKCGTKTAPNCSVLAVGELKIGGVDIYEGSADRKKVKPAKKKTKNPQRRSSSRNSD